MRRMPRIALLLIALAAVAPVLASCDSFDPDTFDPFGINAKKKLPGKRELLFPNGVPGVTQGIPPEYREGYQQPAITNLPPGDIDATPAAAATAKSVPVEPVRQSNLGKPTRVHRSTVTHKPKPKPRVVKRKPKPKPKATATAAEPKGTTAPWPSTPAQSTSQPTGTQAPWPSSPSASSTPPQSSQAGWPSGGAQKEQKLAPWPSAPPSGSFSK